MFSSMDPHIQLNNCYRLKSDNMMLDVDESVMPKSEWTNMQDKDLSTKMQFWWDKFENMDCKISKVKAMVG